MAQTQKIRPKLRRWGRGPNPLILKKTPIRRPSPTAGELATPDGYAVERAAFARVRAELLAKYPGKYIVFVGSDMLGPFDTVGAAVIAARRKHGYVAVYAKRLIEDDSAR